MDKLKKIKIDLQVWNKSVFGHIDTNIATLEDQINAIDILANDCSLSNGEIKQRSSLQQDLWLWLKRKEPFWAQHSCKKWLKEGDQNMKYFHSIASNRKKKPLVEKNARAVSPKIVALRIRRIAINNAKTAALLVKACG